MKLTLIRHTAVAIPRGICYGQSDVALAPTFAQEAEAVSERLRFHIFDRVYCSPLSRCVKLAEYCGYPNAVREPRIMEMNFGEWELKNYDEITDPRLQEWFDDYMNVPPTGGESAMDQRRRFLAFIDDLTTELPHSASVALFTHGGIIAHALNAFTGKSYAEIFRAIPPFGSVIELNI